MDSDPNQFCPGVSPTFRHTVELADLYASSDWPILLLGDSGVGKERLAQRIHQQSQRRDRPFVPINCGALPSGLIESELFGHEKGSFSGAVKSSVGLIRLAAGGTLFLDEIGELELSVQSKVLRFLETGEVRAVGSSKIRKVDARIIAATNVDLYCASQLGQFRCDLLHRLAVLVVRIPALKDRPEDVLALAELYLNEWESRYSRSDLSELLTYRWPGNVRQLINVLARANVIGKGKIEQKILRKLLDEEAGVQSNQPRQAGEVLENGTLAQIEKHVIMKRLKQCGGNKTRTAKELGIGKSTLHNKMRSWTPNYVG